MKNGFQTFQTAKEEADKMNNLFKTPFSIFFDWAWDGINNWRITVGDYRTAEYTSKD